MPRAERLYADVVRGVDADLIDSCKDTWDDPMVVQMCIELADLLDREVLLIGWIRMHKAVDVWR